MSESQVSNTRKQKIRIQQRSTHLRPENDRNVAATATPSNVQPIDEKDSYIEAALTSSHQLLRFLDTSKATAASAAAESVAANERGRITFRYRFGSNIKKPFSKRSLRSSDHRLGTEPVTLTTGAQPSNQSTPSRPPQTSNETPTPLHTRNVAVADDENEIESLLESLNRFATPEPPPELETSLQSQHELDSLLFSGGDESLIRDVSQLSESRSDAQPHNSSAADVSYAMIRFLDLIVHFNPAIRDDQRNYKTFLLELRKLIEALFNQFSVTSDSFNINTLSSFQSDKSLIEKTATEYDQRLETRDYETHIKLLRGALMRREKQTSHMREAYLKELCLLRQRLTDRDIEYRDSTIGRQSAIGSDADADAVDDIFASSGRDSATSMDTSREFMLLNWDSQNLDSLSQSLINDSSLSSNQSPTSKRKGRATSAVASRRRRRQEDDADWRIRMLEKELLRVRRQNDEYVAHIIAEKNAEIKLLSLKLESRQTEISTSVAKKHVETMTVDSDSALTELLVTEPRIVAYETRPQSTSDIDHSIIPPDFLSESRSLTCVSVGVWKAAELWTELQESVVDSAFRIYRNVIRAALHECRGYEANQLANDFLFFFHSVSNAIEFTKQVQLNLLIADWPPEILQTKQASIVYSDNQSESDDSIVLYRGLRTQIGIHCGTLSETTNHDISTAEGNTTETADETDAETTVEASVPDSQLTIQRLGPIIQTAVSIKERALDGQILMSKKALSEVNEISAEVVCLPVPSATDYYYIVPKRLEKRVAGWYSLPAVSSINALETPTVVTAAIAIQTDDDREREQLLLQSEASRIIISKLEKENAAKGGLVADLRKQIAVYTEQYSAAMNKAETRQLNLKQEIKTLRRQLNESHKKQAEIAAAAADVIRRRNQQNAPTAGTANESSETDNDSVEASSEAFESETATEQAAEKSEAESNNSAADDNDSVVDSLFGDSDVNDSDVDGSVPEITFVEAATQTESEHSSVNTESVPESAQPSLGDDIDINTGQSEIVNGEVGDSEPEASVSNNAQVEQLTEMLETADAAVRELKRDLNIREQQLMDSLQENERLHSELLLARQIQTIRTVAAEADPNRQAANTAEGTSNEIDEDSSTAAAAAAAAAAGDAELESEELTAWSEDVERLLDAVRDAELNERIFQLAAAEFTLKSERLRRVAATFAHVQHYLKTAPESSAVPNRSYHDVEMDITADQSESALSKSSIAALMGSNTTAAVSFSEQQKSVILHRNKRYHDRLMEAVAEAKLQRDAAMERKIRAWTVVAHIASQCAESEMDSLAALYPDASDAVVVTAGRPIRGSKMGTLRSAPPPKSYGSAVVNQAVVAGAAAPMLQQKQRPAIRNGTTANQTKPQQNTPITALGVSGSSTNCSTAKEQEKRASCRGKQSPSADSNTFSETSAVHSRPVSVDSQPQTENQPTNRTLDALLPKKQQMPFHVKTKEEGTASPIPLVINKSEASTGSTAGTPTKDFIFPYPSLMVPTQATQPQPARQRPMSGVEGRRPSTASSGSRAIVIPSTGKRSGPKYDLRISIDTTDSAGDSEPMQPNLHVTSASPLNQQHSAAMAWESVLEKPKARTGGSNKPKLTVSTTPTTSDTTPTLSSPLSRQSISSPSAAPSSGSVTPLSAMPQEKRDGILLKMMLAERATRLAPSSPSSTPPPRALSTAELYTKSKQMAMAIVANSTAASTTSGSGSSGPTNAALQLPSLHTHVQRSRPASSLAVLDTRPNKRTATNQ